jgi:hypothetical protein
MRLLVRKGKEEKKEEGQVSLPLWENDKYKKYRGTPFLAYPR